MLISSNFRKGSCYNLAWLKPRPVWSLRGPWRLASALQHRLRLRGLSRWRTASQENVQSCGMSSLSKILYCTISQTASAHWNTTSVKEPQEGLPMALAAWMVWVIQLNFFSVHCGAILGALCCHSRLATWHHCLQWGHAQHHLIISCPRLGILKSQYLSW